MQNLHIRRYRDSRPSRLTIGRTTIAGYCGRYPLAVMKGAGFPANDGLGKGGCLICSPARNLPD